MFHLNQKTSLLVRFQLSTHDFTTFELDEVPKNLPNSKVTGLDDIPGEVWKIGALKEQLL